MDSSRALPTGVVTFLLTDIEGSTRLWEREPDAMREALARHDAIMNTVVRRLNGHVVKSKGEGDSVFAVFRHGRDAISAAVVLQVALAAEQWATATPLRVRMAVHTGQIELRDGDYYGPTVNRCARLRALAQGGQVLVSGVTAQLMQGRLPSGASLRDLGTKQLKDLSAPERVWELTHPRMAAEGGAPGAAELVPAQPRGRAYLVTDHLNRTADGREWGERRTHAVAGYAGDGDGGGLIRCYASPGVAAFLNGLNERFRMPRLWEAVVDQEPSDGSATLECREVTTLRQVSMPTVTGKHYAHFAVLCAREASRGSENDSAFSDWAAGWLAGHDNSGVEARALADAMDNQGHRGAGIAMPEEAMLANAARAAQYSSKLTWLVGRARDEENARAMEFAVEAMHIAMRMTRLDLVALAEQALPKLVAPLTPLRTPAVAAPNRILRALPT